MLGLKGTRDLGGKNLIQIGGWVGKEGGCCVTPKLQLEKMNSGGLAEMWKEDV